MGLLGAAGLTLLLVRQPILITDTTYNKFYASGSYKCPGMPDFWKH